MAAALPRFAAKTGMVTRATGPTSALKTALDDGIGMVTRVTGPTSAPKTSVNVGMGLVSRITGLTSAPKSALNRGVAKVIDSPFALKGVRTFSVQTNKILYVFELNGKAMPAMEAATPTLYQLSLIAESEEEALGVCKKFVTSVCRNNSEMLSTFSTSEVNFVEMKKAIGAVSVEVKQQLTEHRSDVVSEFNAMSTAIMSNKGELKEAVYANTKETLCVKEAVLTNKESLKRIEADGARFTVLKLIGYAGGLSVVNLLSTWGVGEYLQAKAVAIPEPQADDTVRIAVNVALDP